MACAKDKRCIAPTYGIGRGSESTRGNHRQDQAALSMLAYMHGLSCSLAVHKVGVSLHHDGTNDSPLCRKVVGHAVAEHDRNPR